MPSLCPGKTGTPNLWKLSSLPETWSHDYIATHLDRISPSLSSALTLERNRDPCALFELRIFSPGLSTKHHSATFKIESGNVPSLPRDLWTG